MGMSLPQEGESGAALLCRNAVIMKAKFPEFVYLANWLLEFLMHEEQTETESGEGAPVHSARRHQGAAVWTIAARWRDSDGRPPPAARAEMTKCQR